MELLKLIEELLVIIGQGSFVLFIALFILYAITVLERPKVTKKPNPRQVANLEILALLEKRILDQPDERFGQVLRNLGIINDIGVRDSSRHDWETPDYYIDRIIIMEEPSIVLARMKRAKAGVYEETKIK